MVRALDVLLLICYGGRMRTRAVKEVIFWIIVKQKEREDKPLFATMLAKSVDECTDRITEVLNGPFQFISFRDTVIPIDTIASFEVRLRRDRFADES